jgi:hypothetical protein
MATGNILIVQPSMYNKQQVNDQKKKKKKEEKEKKEKEKEKKRKRFIIILYDLFYILQFKRFIICYNKVTFLFLRTQNVFHFAFFIYYPIFFHKSGFKEDFPKQ